MHPNTEPPDQLALRLWTAVRQRDWDRIRSLVHPDAELQAASAGAQMLDRELALTATEVAVTADSYDPKLRTFEALDDHTALVGGETHHRHRKDWLEERHTVWLFTFEDDLLVRSRFFSSITDAIDYHRGESETRNH